MEMILNDRRISADEALQAGLVSRVFPLDTFLDETLKIATEISVRAPLALIAAKKMVNLAQLGVFIDRQVRIQQINKISRESK